jgi:xylulokinase
MKPALLMGIDIGTTGCKTILVDGAGKVIDNEIEGYPLFSPRHGWSEQNPEDWWGAAQNTVRKVAERNRANLDGLAGIGLSGQMHGLVPLDAGGKVIRPAILWNDQRTGPQCERVYEQVGGVQGLLEYTNNRMLPGYTGGKILWVREHEPSNFDRMVKFLNPKDYVRYRLTGETATEVSDASGTGLFDVRSRTWSAKLFERLGIPTGLAPVCHESTVVSGQVAAGVAESLGLPKALPVAGGGGDSVIQTLGTGVISNDVLMTTIGTAGIISTALERYRENPGGMLQVFCNVMPGEWHAMGVTLAAGGSLNWAKGILGGAESEVSRLCGEDVYDLISSEASQSPPGSRGLVFLPYLQGERCPHTDPDARGAFIGLSITTRKSDLFRSVMEGVIFSFRDVAEIFASLGMSFSHIATSGGGAQSGLWRQIHADIFKKRVVTVSGSRGGAAYGAAIVAGVGLGVWSDFREAAGVLKVETETKPNPDVYALYDQFYALYRAFYPLLRESFRGLGDAP